MEEGDPSPNGKINTYLLSKPCSCIGTLEV